jgi:apolipoprotein D and lipocalin family protein
MKSPSLCGLLLVALTCGCASRGPEPALVLAPRVEVPRFMGDWYVLASIPLWPERDSYNGVESYRLDEQGRIQTTYTFRKGGFDGPQKTYRPVGRVHNQATGSEWRMQFIWPFSGAFLIHFVDEAYQTTIIGEPGLKHVWIMARQPQLAEPDLQALIQRAADIGYNVSKLRRVPQRWD